MAAYRVRVLKADDGERVPFLIEGANGMPMFYPTVWQTAMRRSVNLATNTLKSDLVALKALYLWADVEGIDIERRVLQGHYLRRSELDRLKTFLRTPLKANESSSNAKGYATPAKVVSLEAVRRHAPKAKPQLDHATYIDRVRIVAKYVEWLADTGLSSLPANDELAQSTNKEKMIKALLAALPKNKKRNQVGRREGPPEEVIQRLLEVVDVFSVDNPWEDIALRFRNQLIIHLLYGLGIRRGEALGVHVDHIDFRKQTVLIARQADEISDPRVNQPQAKTCDRIMPLSDHLSSMLHNYIVHIRSKFPEARTHPCLLVSIQTGKALSESAFNKIFRELRSRADGLPNDLTPHVMRHAWNDAFSAKADREKLPEAKEEQIRSYLQGWKPGSGTSSTYTRRSTRDQANEYLLEHQGSLIARPSRDRRSS